MVHVFTEGQGKQYFEWLDQNLGGYVVSTGKTGRSGKYCLHLNPCIHVNTLTKLSEESYVSGKRKVCSTSIDQLDHWFKSNSSKYSGQFQHCKTCNPH